MHKLGRMNSYLSSQSIDDQPRLVIGGGGIGVGSSLVKKQ